MAALPTPLRELARIRTAGHWVVSCYLRLEVMDRPRRKYLVELKSALRGAESAVAGLDHEARQQVARDMQRILKAVELPSRLPSAPGLALFACGPRKLFQVIPMPRVHRTRVIVDRTPRLTELMAAEEEAGLLLVAALDRSRARFFAVDPFGIEEVEDLTAVSTRGGKYHSDRQDSPGWGEKHFHQRIEEERHRHFAAVARRLEALDRKRPARGIVLAGPAEETAAAARFLPAHVAERYMGAARLNPTALRKAELRAAVLEVRREFERSRERALVADLESRVAPGWATNGPQATLDALSRGQVRTLFARAGMSGSGFRCGASGRLALSRDGCRGEGEAEPVQDLVNEAVEECLRQRVGVVMLHDAEAAEAVDGLGAILRFR